MTKQKITKEQLKKVVLCQNLIIDKQDELIGLLEESRGEVLNVMIRLLRLYRKYDRITNVLIALVAVVGMLYGLGSWWLF